MINKGQNCIIGKDVQIEGNVTLGHNVIIEDNVSIGAGTYIDSNTIIRNNVYIGEKSVIGAKCIIGEQLMDSFLNRQQYDRPVYISDNAIIRSGTVIYEDVHVGVNFQTGHNVTIRENTIVGDNVSIGTNCDVQGNCSIGSYTRIHSRVFVAPNTVIEDFVWIFPGVILTNDPTPPSEHMLGITVKSYAVIAAGAVLVPGISVNSDSLVAAGTVVTRNVDRYQVVAGNPAKVISDIRTVKNKVTGEPAYPWRYHFKKYMPWQESDFSSWYASLNLDN